MKKKIKILLYTSIIGNYDQQRSDVRVMREDILKNPTRSARYYKCVTPDFNDYDYSIWLDGNTYLAKGITPQFLIKQLGEADIITFKHWRDCVYEEAKVVIKAKVDDPNVVNRQINKYRSEGYPANNGLSVTTYIVRKHTPEVEQFNKLWWNEIANGSARDQLSFDYAVWKTSIKLKHFKETHFDIHKKNTFFEYRNHNEV